MHTCPRLCSKTPPPYDVVQVNSFEQLCINYVNEMLQEQFNRTVLASEESLQQSEGLEVEGRGALESMAPCLQLMGSLLQALHE